MSSLHQLHFLRLGRIVQILSPGRLRRFHLILLIQCVQKFWSHYLNLVVSNNLENDQISEPDQNL